MVNGCPADYAASCGFFDALRARNLMEKGIPPVAGGQLDQTASFLSAVREIDNNVALIEEND